MSRFKLVIEYDWRRYSGSQMQKGAKSVQGELLDAAKELFENRTIDLFGAGRTDSAVHATGQVAHLDVDTDLPLLRIKYGLNDRLPPDISVLNVEEAQKNFNARYDAVARSYVYHISRRRTAFGKKYVWWIKDVLDAEKMNATAVLFTGLKDFRNYTDPEQEGGSTKTEIMHASVKSYGDIILIHFVGSHFLWKQVRRMTGVLVEVGRGKMTEKDVSSFFRGVTDIPAKLTAPPSGLFLEKVYYNKEDIIFSSKPVINL